MRKNLSTSSFSLLAALIVFALVFLFSEIVIRYSKGGVDSIFHFFQHSPQDLFYTDFLEEDSDPSIGFKLKKDLSGHFKGEVFSTDQWGGRTINIASNESQNASAKKIVVVGRSIDMGEGVNDEETWPSVFANEVSKEQKDLQVFNFSTSGYNWTQIRRFADVKLKDIDPKVVILPLYLKEWSIPFQKEPLALPSTDFRNYFQANSFLNNFYIFQSVRFLFKTLTVNLLSSDWDYRALGTLDRKTHATLAIELPKITMPILDQGRRVVIVVHPNLLQKISPQESEAHQILFQWANGRSGVQIIEPLPEEIPVGIYEPISFGNPHPNFKYHQFLGRHIARKINLEGL